MNSPKIVFVVLQYFTSSDTISCVGSILKLDNTNNIKVIIVDNASPNDAGNYIRNYYLNDPKVIVFINSENLGFAKGHNVGFAYAKNELKADYIILLNNDTYILQSDFTERLLKVASEHSFDILGPDIVSPDGSRHQNPKPETIHDKHSLKKSLRQHRLLLVLNYMAIEEILERFKKIIIPKKVKLQAMHHDKVLENVKLSGACLIFYTTYIKKYDGLYPKTFLYSEEAILTYIARRDNLKAIYSPDLQIVHTEDATTNKMFNNKLLKRRHYIKNFIKSGNAFLELIEKDEQDSR